MTEVSRNRLYLICTFAEAVAVKLSNRIRRFFGFKIPPSSRDIFLNVFWLHARGRQPRLRITCAERTDGAGAQAHTIMSAINFARFFGHTYVHTPFAEIDHADRPMAEWVAAWEELFNLGDNEEQSGSDNPRALNYSTFHPRLYHAVSDTLARIGARSVFGRNQSDADDHHFHPFFYHSDSNPDSFESVIPEFRRKYYRGSAPTRNPKITVGVHLRRGDVGPAHQRRFTSLDTVCETLRQAKSILDALGEDHTIALFSEGEAADFREMQAMGAKLFLNADALWTMRHLIEADILIMSKSSFSYVAALISDGIKLYEPFWHSPLSGWIRREPGGEFDPNLFGRQLEQLIDGRRVA
jgi:hypothetical protein